MTYFLAFLVIVKHNLIAIMSGVLFMALGFRYLAYKSGRRDEIYFKTFARAVEKYLESNDSETQVHNVDQWLSSMLDKVTDELPRRNIRLHNMNVQHKDKPGFRTRRVSFSEFAEGQKSIAHAIRQHMDAFRSAHPPSFVELTHRILEQDRQWNNILRIVPVDRVSRMLDILPGLFVVSGIFGTFVGIIAGLPKIASIDMTNMQSAAPIINSFVTDIAFSMTASIVGIACNIVMTILNGLYPVNEMRSDIVKTVERSLEFIWHRIHGNVSQSEAKMIQLLEGILSELQGSRHSSKKAA